MTEFFFPNDEADTHCVQACYQMVVARLTGTELTLREAEEQTGFADGMLTWQFAMLLSLNRVHGLYVVDHEDFEPEEFVADPIRVLRAQIGDDEAVRHQIAHTDLDAEVSRARACLENPAISFLTSAPSMADLRSAVDAGAQVICLVNGAVLDGNPEYRPHSVVLRSMTDEVTVIDDPGPPARPSWEIPTALFEKAWLNPTPTVANYIACAGKPLP